ncbi:2Fe-2S iron-sulfur cluster-binding protein [Candidatus Berkiella aquae]|uniref:(2Fe-2S)-binding protein n=1 Tax=Candidatus Berkiella aquae TaxID=295108 RepID=A0A0Q9YMI8_9GAMM|nr:2Fe-2S iron-sulfur cluster-binding protein [Candidatus Berkiella aquae]MCS5710314.1 (2Fe-2S)-binding protein [Candidatus Berkiella aquae]
MKKYTINFIDSDKAQITLTEGSELCEHLTAINSPVLFGCRSGICGTCLCEIEAIQGQLPEPSFEEQDALALYAPSNKKARLACQVQLLADITIKKIECYE